MNTKQVITLLEENKNQRGIDNWHKLTTTNMKSFGIGLTVLRKLAKKVGRNANLASELWKSNYYDAKVISLLIDDPKTITKEQAETQVEQLEGGYLAHVFSSCDATLAKTNLVKELADEWILSDHLMRKRCGYGLLYELSKSKKKSAPNDDYFINQIKYIEKHYKNEDKNTLLAMGGALLGMGKRSADIHKVAVKLAKKIGPIDFNEEGQTCDPFDVEKNLTSEYMVKKFNL